MKERNSALNVIGIIFAVVLSLILIPTLILTPVLRGLSALAAPEFLQGVATEVVEEIDFGALYANDPEMTQSLVDSGLSPEAARALMDSQFVQEALQLAGRDLAQVLQGTFTTSALTDEELLRLAREHRDELIGILRLLEPEAAALSDEEMGAVVDTMVSEQMVGMAAEMNEVMFTLQDTMYGEGSIVPVLMSSTLIWVMAGITFVLAGLVYLCRLRNQEGLLWLGIDSALAALPVLGIAVSLKGAQISQLLAQEAVPPSVFDPFLRRFGNATLVGGVVLLALAVVLIALFVWLRDRRTKKQTAQELAGPEIL